MKKKAVYSVLFALSIVLLFSFSVQAQDRALLLSYDFEDAEIGDLEAPPSSVDSILLSASNFSVERVEDAFRGEVRRMWSTPSNSMWFMHALNSTYPPTDYSKFAFGFTPSDPIEITQVTFDVYHTFYTSISPSYSGKVQFTMEFYDTEGTLVTSFDSQKVPCRSKTLVSLDTTGLVLDQEVLVRIRAKSRIESPNCGDCRPESAHFFIDNVQLYQPDTDGDGVGDAGDNCPDTAPGSDVFSDGCSVDDLYMKIDDLQSEIDELEAVIKSMYTLDQVEAICPGRSEFKGNSGNPPGKSGNAPGRKK